ncbi:MULTISPECIES: thioredoxin domain-containing protein [unclassified Wenzhouxiangella]|uniref:thioredoxin domain-containing protein n=1 Tax=unclassified Wenzhouxiangella TaxID=2613841 RepID=UPI000E32C46D|nr:MULTISPECIES: thioredoxin domain-containing protein [unclassified Wenzhouxiangella]RFF27905.1 thioredoxin domain-containing protein [Wenzhouxiangella sp. 15181]RFP67220.1 thioredoxin domain-containing protein [Wenzhouxiangella sp. 15190]
MSQQKPENRLGDALSPYLLQHAGNPVAWQPWDREALAMARTLDRPILLSIGYSACHWCHVMAHESFENDEIAERMNAYFVNIKVDREERPDLDRIYQLAHQLLTGRGGGWPLTVFLDPASQAPFFAGTYFPPEPRHGMIAFGDLLARIHQVWSTRREELRAQHLQVQEALQAIATPTPAGEADLASSLDSLTAEAGARFDRDNGGFGGGPKFPQAPLLAALAETEGEHPAQILGDTLTAMARHGLHDHLGGGFFRYCVDAVWEIPHFEKMLSDNALLLGLYARAATRWNRADFRAVCERLVEWLEREMSLDTGGFAASLDADSEEGEGAFYVWTRKEVAEKLSSAEHDLFCARFGLDGPPNFESEYWHLVVARSRGELVEENLDEDEIDERLESARQRLLAARQERPTPGLDDKMLASWNGLAIENLAVAGRLLGREDWLERAAGALDAVAVNLFGQEPPRAVWREGRSAQTALLDEHANVLLACLELLGWRFETRWLNLARRIARRIVEHFADDASGALHLTPDDYETLLTRPLAHADDATPAGAGQAVLGLARLGHLVGESDLIDAAHRAVDAARGDIERSALAHATLVHAWQALEHPGPQILLAGPEDPVADWQRELSGADDCTVYRLPADLESEDLPELLRPLIHSECPVAMTCIGQRCLAPVHSLEELSTQLAESRD